MCVYVYPYRSMRKTLDVGDESSLMDISRCDQKSLRGRTTPLRVDDSPLFHHQYHHTIPLSPLHVGDSPCLKFQRLEPGSTPSSTPSTRESKTSSCNTPIFHPAGSSQNLPIATKKTTDSSSNPSSHVSSPRSHTPSTFIQTSTSSSHKTTFPPLPTLDELFTWTEILQRELNRFENRARQ